MAVTTEYSIWVVEYAHVLEFPVSGILYGRHNVGTMVFPYCYGVLKSDDHIALVDCGFDNVEMGAQLAQTYGVTGWQPPTAVLAKIGLSPDEVDTLILTHLHFDHAGNADAFPGAHVYIQEEEIRKFLWAKSLPRRLSTFLTMAFDPDDVLGFVRRCSAGTLTLLEGDAEVLPGVRCLSAKDTHTLGSQYVVVDDGRGGRWVLAGDNVYVWENLEGEGGNGEFIPIGLATGSQKQCLLTMEEMYQTVGGHTTNILPFHEQHLWDRFPSRLYDDGLHVAEVSLRPGDKSVLA